MIRRYRGVNKISFKKRSERYIKPFIACIIFFSLLFISFRAESSNVQINNVKMKNLNPFSRTAQIEFSLSQDSPYTQGVLGANDYIWVFGKYWVEGVDSAATGWHHIELADNQKGLFIPSETAGEYGTVFSLDWDFKEDDELFQSLSKGKGPKVRICAIEMVEIPESDDLKNFYISKYEVSQGQYADYLNMLGTDTAQKRWAGRRGNGYAIFYDSRAEYGSKFLATAPERACNFISFKDAQDYADWVGLRLLKEREWEAAATGPKEIAGKGNTRLYPWGDTNPGEDNPIYEQGKYLGFYQHYANFGNLKGTGQPSDVGFYCLGDIMRNIAQTGVSPFGIPDLAGNVAEWIMNSEQDFGLKGGSFASGAEGVMISASKAKLTSDARSPEAGLRIAR